MSTSATPAPGEEPILADLAAQGIETRSLADLRHSGNRYRKAIPVLLKWLPQITDRKVKEEVVRALSVPWAKPDAAEPLIEEFRLRDESPKPSNAGLYWSIGNAVSIVANDEAHFSELAELAANPGFGRSRQMIVLALGKLRNPEAIDVLLGLIDDPDVDGHAVKALSVREPAPRARSAFERKLGDKRAWVRNAARRGLEKLETSAR